MSTELGEAQVPIRATLEKLDGDLADARSKIDRALDGFKGLAANVGKIALGGLVAGVAALGGAAALVGPALVDMGADANETASLLQTSLGPAAASLNDELRSFADAANRSFYELQQGSSTFVAMTRSMGATQDEAGRLGVSFTKAATDLGSFFNVATGDALMDIQSALAGSSETMTKYGIDIRETTLKQMALEQGLISSATETLPQLVRAQLIEQAIMEQGADAMGDAIRTSDSWSNSMRGLKGQLRDAGTEMGQKLIPALQPFLTLVGDMAATWLPKLGDVLSAVIPALTTVAETVQSFVGNLQEGMSPLDAFIEAIWDIAPQEVLDALVRLRDEILPGLVSWFETTIQPIIDAALEFEHWREVAVALAAGLAAFVVISTVVGWISGLIGAVSGVVAAISSAGGVVGGIVALLGGPLTIVIAAVVGLVALLAAAWTGNWGDIQGKTKEAWENYIQPALAAIGEWITGTLIPTVQELWMQWTTVWWPAISQALSDAWNNIILPVLTAIGEWITGTLIPKVQELWDQWVNVWWPAISQALSDAWNNIILPVLTAIGEWITGTLIPKVRELWDKWVNVWWPEIQRALENAWTAIKAIWEELGRWINDNIVPWVEFLHQKWVEEIWPAIQGAVETVWEIIQPIWEAFREYLEDKLPVALEGLRGVLETVMTAISTAIQPVKDLWDALVGAVTSFWDWISSHTFKFSISIPDLPDWAVPGSPLPIHTAWHDFAQEMNGMVIAPRIDLESGGSGSGSSRETVFNIEANYGYQREGSLRDDIKLLQMLAA